MVTIKAGFVADEFQSNFEASHFKIITGNLEID